MFRDDICSRVLRELLDVCAEPLNCTGLCNLASVVLELLLDEKFHSKFPCPRNSLSCTSS